MVFSIGSTISTGSPGGVRRRNAPRQRLAEAARIATRSRAARCTGQAAVTLCLLPDDHRHHAKAMSTQKNHHRQALKSFGDSPRLRRCGGGSPWASVVTLLTFATPPTSRSGRELLRVVSFLAPHQCSRDSLESQTLSTSAPCRGLVTIDIIDMKATMDIQFLPEKSRNLS